MIKPSLHILGKTLWAVFPILCTLDFSDFSDVSSKLPQLGSLY